MIPSSESNKQTQYFAMVTWWYIYIYTSYCNIWKFPKIGAPPNYPFIDGLSLINHPAIGYPHLWKPPYCNGDIITIFTTHGKPSLDTQNKWKSCGIFSWHWGSTRRIWALHPATPTNSTDCPMMESDGCDEDNSQGPNNRSVLQLKDMKPCREHMDHARRDGTQKHMN